MAKVPVISLSGNPFGVAVTVELLIRPALEFMMKNYQENISIDQLADLTNLSKSYFMGCFKKAVGVGAIEHLTQLRINAACEACKATMVFSCMLPDEYSAYAGITRELYFYDKRQ